MEADSRGEAHVVSHAYDMVGEFTVKCSFCEHTINSAAIWAQVLAKNIRTMKGTVDVKLIE